MIMNCEAETDIDQVDLFGTPCPELFGTDVHNCLFLGHSFIGRLQKWIKSPQNNLGKNLAMDNVTIDFIVDYTIPQLNRALQKSLNLVARCDAIFIDIGGNDLCDNDCDEHVVFEMCKSLIINVREANANCSIIVMQQLHRQHIYKRKICEKRRERHEICCSEEKVKAFNKRIDSFNCLLKSSLYKINRVKYWCHKSLWSVKKFNTIYDADGIHLSAVGMKKYARSVRGAIQQALKRC
jgi:lysophospholipase L1-like esterase